MYQSIKVTALPGSVEFLRFEIRQTIDEFVKGGVGQIFFIKEILSNKFSGASRRKADKRIWIEFSPKISPVFLSRI